MIKKIFSLQKNDLEEFRFHSFEMTCRYNSFYEEESKNRKMLSLDFITYWFYKKINNFGQNIYRPFKLVVILSIIFFIIIFIMQSCDLPGINEKACDFPNTYPKTCGIIQLTLLVFFGPFKYFLNFGHVNFNTSFLAFFTPMCALLSSILWFFFILGLRRAFKIK